MEIRVKARLAFPAIWAPTSVNNGPEKFRARLMFDPDTDWGKASIKLIRETRLKVATDKWKTKAKAEAIMETLKGDRNKETWSEKDYRNQEGDVLEGFEGMFHMSALNDVQPLIIDADRTELTRRDGRPYSGCYVVAMLDIFAQDNTHGKGMRCGLNGLQFWKDGDAFGGGGRKAKADQFEDLSDQGDEDGGAPPTQREARARPEGGTRERAARAPVEDDEDEIA